MTAPPKPGAAPGYAHRVPIYEFRCSECDVVFDERRSVADSDAPAPSCPNGHATTRRVLSVFASVGASATSGSTGFGPPAGGGCGAGCACAANA
jgi:putative FmdB family regulatory protein